MHSVCLFWEADAIWGKAGEATRNTQFFFIQTVVISLMEHEHVMVAHLAQSRVSGIGWWSGINPFRHAWGAPVAGIFSQIAIVIGILTSNRGEGDEPLWRIGRGTRVPLQGAVDVVPLLGAIVGYHCSVLWLGGRVTTNFNFGGMDVVPSLGAIAGCHRSVLWWGAGRVTTGVDVVPLLGAIVVCYGGGRGG